jgi:hypothetical protein
MFLLEKKNNYFLKVEKIMEAQIGILIVSLLIKN